VDQPKEPADAEPDNQKHLARRRVIAYTVYILISLVSLAVVVAVLIVASRWLNTNISDRVQFVTANLLNALIFAAIVAQVLIYRKQRDIMREQRIAMGKQHAAMELQAGIAEIQTGLVDQQVSAMKGQLEAMREQLGVMERQETAMRNTVELTEQGLRASNRSYVGIHSLEAELEKERVILQIENTGTIPAEGVKVSGKASVVIPGFVARLGRHVFGDLTVDIASCPFHEEFESLFRGNLKGRMVIDLFLIVLEGGQHYLSSVADSSGTLIIEGQIEYGDGFDPMQITRFAFNYDTESGWTARPIKSSDESDQTE